MKLTTFLYGPQTSGKTTRLLRIIQRDGGNDLAFSGENQRVIDNGKLMAQVSAPLPKILTHSAVHRMDPVLHQRNVKHVLIDGAQFLPVAFIKQFYHVIRERKPKVPIIFSGCLYYLGQNNSQMIAASRFLLEHCNRVVHVNRRCEFCSRLADRLWSRGVRTRGKNTVMVNDPHLVCQKHYRQLNRHFNQG